MAPGTLRPTAARAARGVSRTPSRGHGPTRRRHAACRERASKRAGVGGGGGWVGVEWGGGCVAWPVARAVARAVASAMANAMASATADACGQGRGRTRRVTGGAGEHLRRPAEVDAVEKRACAQAHVRCENWSGMSGKRARATVRMCARACGRARAAAAHLLHLRRLVVHAAWWCAVGERPPQRILGHQHNERAPQSTPAVQRAQLARPRAQQG